MKRSWNLFCKRLHTQTCKLNWKYKEKFIIWMFHSLVTACINKPRILWDLLHQTHAQILVLVKLSSPLIDYQPPPPQLISVAVQHLFVHNTKGLHMMYIELSMRSALDSLLVEYHIMRWAVCTTHWLIIFYIMQCARLNLTGYNSTRIPAG